MNFIECTTIVFSCNAVLDAISSPDTLRLPHHKTRIRTDNTTSDYWTRKIDMSSLTGKSLNMLFCILLMNQQLGLDSAYLLGRVNQFADATSCLKHNLASVKSLL